MEYRMREIKGFKDHK